MAASASQRSGRPRVFSVRLAVALRSTDGPSAAVPPHPAGQAMTISQDRASSFVDRNATGAKRARSNWPPKLGRKHDRASSVRRIAYIAPKRKRILVRTRTPQVDGKIKLAVIRNVLNGTRAPGRKRCPIESPISTHRCLPTSGSQQECHKQKSFHAISFSGNSERLAGVFSRQDDFARHHG